ncbi:condensation domain-containing protein, partial [Bacillus pseudomycoides]|uniref:condensation domain-containing protein n=3 Tax=Bacillus pseudomycoides TaxID=64104 RepID=UPI003D23664C
MSSIDNNIDTLSHDERRKLLEKILLNESEGFSTFPLSFSQQRLWFLEQFMPGSPVYNYPLVLRLCGLLNVKVLEKSLNEILHRHDILRISISSEKGKAVQNVNPYKKLTISIIDLSDLMEDERENLAIQKAKQEVQKPFMLSKGPLIRFTLIKLNQLEHILVVNTHHIISDGWSMGVLINELSVLYEAFNKGLNSPLPNLPIQYTDYAAWQREWLEGEVLEKQGAYWKEKLGGDLPILELPTDRPPSNSPSLRGSLYEFKIPKDLTEKLKSLCKEEGSTLYMLLLATYNVLLHRYSGQDDILVGTPIANRDREEVENLIGFFVNTLVLRTNFSGNLTFRQLLRQVREAALESYTHQDFPFDRLVEELKPDRGMSQSPLFRVMFQYQNAPMKPVTMSDLTVESLSIYREAAKFDLTLTFMDEEETDSLIGYLEYNMDLFDLKTIERMIEHFWNLLLGIVNNPDQLIAKLPLLSEYENDTLLNWNNTLTPYPKEKCFHELFEEQVEKTPDAIAVAFEEEKLTYRELNNRANQLAHYLKKQGIGPEVLVGIC